MNRESLVSGLRFRIHHTMLPVADLDRSVAFYTRLLGMTLKERHANQARKVDVGLVGYGSEGTEPLLELTQDISEKAPVVRPLNAHIAIDVSDLAQLCTILTKENIPFVRALKQRSDGKGLSAWIRDPDGHEIELAERHPDK